MGTGQWISHGYEMIDGNHIRSLYVRGEQWQLYTTMEDGQALGVEMDLYNRWIDMGWIEPGVFEEVYTPEKTIYLLSGRSGYLMASIKFGPYPHRRDQALSFIKNLCRSRKRMGNIQLDDALYIDQFSRILPGNAKKEPENETILIGHFLTGGIDVPVNAPKQLLTYAPYLNERDVDQILNWLELEKDEGATSALTPLPNQTVTERAVDQLQTRQKTHMPGEPFLLPGRPKLEQFFNEEIIEIIDHEDEYRRMGVDFPGATLLYGPPGSGKTYAVKQLTEYLGWPVFHIDSSGVGSKYVHETSKMISAVFDKAAGQAPSVIIMDELEAFLSDRGSAHASREIHMEETAEFLRRIQEVSEKRILLFGMTNMRDDIDKAFLRHGRFDYQIEVGMPSRQDILAILESLLSDKPKEAEIDLEIIATKLEDRPISDIAFAVREAGRLTVRRRKDKIGQEELEHACNALEQRSSEVRKIGFNR